MSATVTNRSPLCQGITPTQLRNKIHRLGPTAHLVRLRGWHYIATVGRNRYEGTLREVHEQLQPTFTRFSIV